MKVYEILPGKLYQRGRLTVRSEEIKLRFLAELRIGLVIGLAGDYDRFLGEVWIGDYWHCPLPDGRFQSRLAAKFEALAERAAAWLSLHRTAALVHCEGGRNRASLLNALILTQLLGLSKREALEYVLARRPNAFGNPDWRSWLEGQCPTVS